jgi:spore germination cell wall hydrolase CwlJ-like protein
MGRLQMLNRIVEGVFIGFMAINATVAQVNPDINLMARMVQAEAGNQIEDGQRLVIDCVLNRAESEYFPNTVSEVINAPGQFEVVANGAIRKAKPTDAVYELIRQERKERTNNEVIYFTAGGFNPSGEPWQKVGDHYFSTIRKDLKDD